VYGTPATFGYGVPGLNQAGCFTEGTNGNVTNCSGDNRIITEITPVVWHSFYKGPAGTLRMALQYEWARRTAWRGTGGNRAPQGDEHVIMTALRWFFP
jgi:hypothetical protein